MPESIVSKLEVPVIALLTHDIILKPHGKIEERIESDGVTAHLFHYESFTVPFAPDATVAFSEITFVIRADNYVYISIRIDSQSDPEMNGPYNDITIHHLEGGATSIQRFAKFRWEGNTHFTKIFPVGGKVKIEGSYRTRTHPTWRFWW